jgi:hypothetical protein
MKKPFRTDKTLTQLRNLTLNRKGQGFGAQYGRFSALREEDLDVDRKRSDPHRVHRANDPGQDWLRKQAAMNYMWEKLLIMRSPIQLPLDDECL